ncbi:MAG: hypothetical protein LBE13_13595 [Bacteroidales bacterium]|jgi:hypothetical protein|nr:hypothetical protein [Bacteroidales bacterium]
MKNFTSDHVLFTNFFLGGENKRIEIEQEREKILAQPELCQICTCPKPTCTCLFCGCVLGGSFTDKTNTKFNNKYDGKDTFTTTNFDNMS